VLRRRVDASRKGDSAARGAERPAGLTRRMIAASALLALIIGGAFATLLLAIGDLRGAERRTGHAQNVLVTANHLERLVLDLETGQRGFVITGEERFLEPWNAARAAFPGRVATLLALVGGEPTAERKAARIAQRARAYIRDYSVPLVTASRRGKPWVRSIAATEAGKRRVDAIRRDFDALIAAERSLDARSKASADSAARRASAGAAIGVAGSIVLIGLYAGYLTRAIVRPIRRAAQMAGRLAGGDLGARMPETGVGEIGALEHAFNVMGSSLERSRDSLAGIAAEQAALRRVATLVAQGQPPEAVFTAVAVEVGRLLPVDYALVARYNAGGTATGVGGWARTGEPLAGNTFDLDPLSAAAQVVETGRPARVDGYPSGTGRAVSEVRAPGITSTAGAPIRVGGSVWGVVLASSTRKELLPPSTEERLAQFTELVATAIANAETQTELTASRARIVATADETRRRIERDLHDGAQQRLVSLALQLRAAQTAVPPDLDQLAAELDGVAAGLNSAIDELREFGRGIHPAILAEGGLGPALKSLANRSALPVELSLRADRRLPDQVEVATYYVVSEALTNVAKHAHASTVAVEIESLDSVVRISVRDDGIGGANLSGGSGLVGLRDRVEAFGGRISVESPPGAGTSLEVKLPVDDGDGDRSG
jgi:signal transduction histidine kinase